MNLSKIRQYYPDHIFPSDWINTYFEFGWLLSNFLLKYEYKLFFCRLKKLHLSFDLDVEEPPNFWKTFASRLNVSSIVLEGLEIVCPHAIEPMSRVTGLDHLSFSASRICVTTDDFKALVLSQLKTIHIQADDIYFSGILSDFPPKFNETVTDLTLHVPLSDYDEPSLIITLFTTYFRGLVHLELKIVDDAIMQDIFKYCVSMKTTIFCMFFL